MINNRSQQILAPLMFLVGATSTLDFSLVGRITLAEVIAFTSIPFLMVYKHFPSHNKNLVKCVWILGLMALGIIVGDLVNQTPILLSLRAIARPVFILGFCLFFIGVLNINAHLTVYFIYGRVVAGLVNYFRPSAFEGIGAVGTDSYQGIVFRVEPLIGTICIALAVYYYQRRKFSPVILFLAAGVITVVFGGTRSGVLIWLVSSFIMWGIWFMRSRYQGRGLITRGKLVLLGSAVVLVLTLAYFGYIYAAPRGYLGEVQAEKIEEQSKTVFGQSPLGFIIAGRTKVYAAVLGIMDRPIFGFGSWRHDLTQIYVVEAMATVGTDSEIIDRIRNTGRTGGAGHSIFFQTWLQNGIIPAFAYLMAFFVLAKVFLHFINRNSQLTPFVVATFVRFTWDFFFSPPSVQMRFTIGLFFAMYVIFLVKNEPFGQRRPLPRHQPVQLGRR